MAELMGSFQYAKYRNCHHQSVQKAIKSGRISHVVVDGKKMVDPAKADIEWIANANPNQVQGYQNSMKKKLTATPSPKIEVLPPSESEEEESKAQAEQRKNRSIKELYQAKLAKLEYEEKAGTLVGAKAVQEQAFQQARILRDAILNVPAKCSHKLAAITDPHLHFIELEKELKAALSSLAEEKLEEPIAVDSDQ